MINILNKINDYILVIDKNGGIKFCNNLLLSKLGYDNLSIKTIENLTNTDINDISNSINEDIDLIFINTYNDKIQISCKITLDYFYNEECIYIIGDTRKSFEDAESIKNEFFANVSHEFKTPLNLILGTVQLLDKNIQRDNIISKGNIDLNKHTKCIKQNSYRLLRLANNIIDMTKIESGYSHLELGNHDIINIVEDITLSVSTYAEQLGINLVFDTDCEEIILACDPDKIERIILNLLSNAIKYTPCGGEINVLIKTTDSNVIVSIKDSGSGISSDKLQVIFERYAKAENLERKIEGSGIGLSLVKSLIDMHDGNITVNSELGKGSEFIFNIPIRLTDRDAMNNINISNYPNVEKCNIEFSDIYSI